MLNALWAYFEARFDCLTQHESAGKICLVETQLMALLQPAAKQAVQVVAS